MQLGKHDQMGFQCVLPPVNKLVKSAVPWSRRLTTVDRRKELLKAPAASTTGRIEDCGVIATVGLVIYERTRKHLWEFMLTRGDFIVNWK